MRGFLVFLALLFPGVTLAFDGPFSYAEMRKCRTLERCDENGSCKRVNKRTRIIWSQMVWISDHNVAAGKFPEGYIQKVEQVVWIELPSDPNILIPLPIWHEGKFTIEEWLDGSLVSPFDFPQYAYVVPTKQPTDGQIVNIFARLGKLSPDYTTSKIICKRG